MVNESVEQSCGELLTAEDLDPFSEVQVRSDDVGFVLVPFGEKVEQKLASLFVEWDEAQFVDD